MGIFSRKKTANTSKVQAAPSTDTEAPRVRSMYIPRYAERDALNCVPGGVRADELEAFRRANAIRMSRTVGECSRLSHHNPKMSARMSRESSSMSFDWSQQSLSRHSNPFPSGSASYQSLPAVLQATQPPVPQIPSQYSPQASSVDSSSFQSHHRSGSFNDQQLRPRSFSRPRSVQQRASYQVASPLGQSSMTSHGESDNPIADAPQANDLERSVSCGECE